MHPLTLLFLRWIDERPRSYGEAMDAWRTSCPQLSIWEDALIDGLVAIARDEKTSVTLTPLGRAALERSSGTRERRLPASP